MVKASFVGPACPEKRRMDLPFASLASNPAFAELDASRVAACVDVLELGERLGVEGELASFA